jgi:hypothetical protein
MNLLFFPVVILAALFFLAAYRLGMRPAPLHWRTCIAAVACALPAVLMAAYYLHLYDDALWFYEFRSLPLAELSASAAGFPAGLIQAWIVRRAPRLSALVPGLLLIGLFVPYMKPVIAPLDLERLKAVCKDGVCLQTTASTCGPASAASVLRLFNVEETEKTLAKEAFTSSGGTENWYLARALRRRGFDVRYEILDRPVAKLPYPSIAGVTLPGGGGHFIAVLGETPEAYVVGEPMSGKLVVPKTRIGAAYSFTGFFMVVGKR